MLTERAPVTLLNFDSSEIQNEGGQWVFNVDMSDELGFKSSQVGVKLGGGGSCMFFDHTKSLFWMVPVTSVS